jgi:hypothetical protein
MQNSKLIFKISDIVNQYFSTLPLNINKVFCFEEIVYRLDTLQITVVQAVRLIQTTLRACLIQPRGREGEGRNF